MVQRRHPRILLLQLLVEAQMQWLEVALLLVLAIVMSLAEEHFVWTTTLISRVQSVFPLPPINNLVFFPHCHYSMFLCHLWYTLQ